MKSPLTNLALLLLASTSTTALAASNVSLPNGWFTIPPAAKISPASFHGAPRYLTWMADSHIKHGIEPTHAYTVSAFLSGVKLAYDRTGDEKYYAFIEKHTNIQLYPDWNGQILGYNNSNSIDDIRFGHTFLDMYNLTNGEEIYKIAAQTLRDQIDRSRRTPAGGFYHRYPEYADQMWLDGIYMLDVFYARWTHEFEPANTTAWDDIALQFDLIDAGTRGDWNRTHGLPVHGFDVSKTQIWADPVTGAAPHVWGRAVGWYIMALIDTLDYFPAHHPGRARLLTYLHSLADAIVAVQDSTYKGWYNIMDPGLEVRSGNYIESSGTAMFVYGLFKSLRLGYVSGAKYVDAAMSAWELMTGVFVEERGGDGALAWGWTVQTGSLSSNGSFEYYASIPLFENDLKGVAPFLFSAYEYELFVEGKK
ncbi:glycoside hydrolase family 105 protein [Dothidotthia symphoricarpi CBS 119687]|uniref:Glycoside hydrolase family 105 protein n=1 Tax=Dothidotthia symphoricarpi CBS 119687 TaxID=1392245 RepID=A0A6A6AMR6_9PLEO|nr:glycoside hydrolase family 105 protein [Dothidotthia symphoricarpi CBS 119687]KAF2132375.1 glycoside hydrolase family 105 protein [Dothidotthia symphoricarpi CBS 119687]